MINLFGLEFKRRLDIGYEYFEGDLNNMIQLIFNYYFNNNISKISETNMIIKEQEEPNKVEALNLKLEKTNLKLEKQKIKQEKDKRKIETIKKEKEKLEKKQNDKIEKEALQKLEEEKKLQKKQKTNLFNELREKVANMVEENYFIKYSFSICKIIKLSSLNGLSNYINKVINSREDEHYCIFSKIKDIYDYEVYNILYKMKFQNLKKRIIIKIYLNILNPNILCSRNLIKEIKDEYAINDNVLKNAKLEKLNIMYDRLNYGDQYYNPNTWDYKIYKEYYNEYYDEDETMTIEEEL